MFTATLDVPLSDCAHHREQTIDLGRADDINLVQRIRTGDQSAFRELVERHHFRILRVLYGILNHRDDAEDVAQDVFVKVYFSIRQFDHRGSLFTWIYSIAVNEAYSHLRRRRARHRCGSDSAVDAGVADLHSLVDGRPTPDRVVAQREFLNKLLVLIPEEDRLLLLWKEVGRLRGKGTGRIDRNEREHRQDKAVPCQAQTGGTGCSFVAKSTANLPELPGLRL